MLDWPATASLDQSQITTACALDYVMVTAPDLVRPGRYSKLEKLLARLRTRPEFIATTFSEYMVPKG